MTRYHRYKNERNNTICSLDHLSLSNAVDGGSTVITYLDKLSKMSISRTLYWNSITCIICKYN